MTNNEASGILAIVVETAKGRCFVTDEAISDAYAMTISALQAQEAKAQLSAEGTTSDLISRQAAIDRINKQREHLQPDIYPQDKIGDAAYRICAEFIGRLPSAQPTLQPTCNELATDTISRQDAIDALMDFDKKLRKINWYQYPHTEYECRGVDEAIVKIENVPSAQPERKTGRWLIREGISDAQCSECKMYFRDVYDMDNSDAFCRHCGAKMEGLKVVEDE